MDMADILVVDDDQSIASALEKFLRLEGHECTLASNADDALRSVGERQPDLVIMDVRMPGVDGLEALELMRRSQPSLQVVIMTAHGTSQTSIDAMRAGAFEYVTKPFDLDQVRSVIARVMAARPPRAGQEQDADPHADVSLVGDVPAMREIYKMIGTLAPTTVPALIVGEHGTGKELVAATIHRNSLRSGEPFVSVDCAALPAEAIEAEILAAGAGTLYLAEVTALPRLLQARLVRMLTPKAVPSAPEAAVPRVLASTERPIEKQVESGAFSRELLDLLSVVTITLPPLRNRLADIPALVTHLIHRLNAELNREIVGIDEQVLTRFREHSWPGNVQELASLLKRAAIVGRGAIITADQIEPALRDQRTPDRAEIESALALATKVALQERLVEMPTGAESSVFHDIVGLVETALVKEALTITNGNQVKASTLLGVNRATLRKRTAVAD
jgi:DNA-binding NtrC family response regulator